MGGDVTEWLPNIMPHKWACDGDYPADLPVGDSGSISNFVCKWTGLLCDNIIDQGSLRSLNIGAFVCDDKNKITDEIADACGGAASSHYAAHNAAIEINDNKTAALVELQDISPQSSDDDDGTSTHSIVFVDVVDDGGTFTGAVKRRWNVNCSDATTVNCAESTNDVLCQGDGTSGIHYRSEQCKLSVSVQTSENKEGVFGAEVKHDAKCAISYYDRDPKSHQAILTTTNAGDPHNSVSFQCATVCASP